MEKTLSMTLAVFVLFVSSAALFGAPAGPPAAIPAQSYLVVCDTGLPTGMARSLSTAGAKVTSLIPQIGLAVVSSADPAFKTKAAKIRGVTAVVPNPTIQWIGRNEKAVKMDIGNPPYSGAGDWFFDLQWGHTAIQAPAAWDTGALGLGVRVAVLDSGIAQYNPDLAPNLNTELSKSFVPGEEYWFSGGLNDFSHGTHVSGTIAAAMNGWGVIGVAPEAELVMVKVLSETTGSGSWGGILQGIVYAADIQADVINMSLGGFLPRRGFTDEDGIKVSASDISFLINLMNRATSYATTHGSTVVASAGNAALDFDHTADWVHMPAQAVGVLAVSATAPIGWALDPDTSLDVPTSYTDYGLSAISLAAPGGDGMYPGDDFCTVVIRAPCVAFDFVFSDGMCDQNSCNFWWGYGTSMATPHVSGVAALIIGRHGGSMDPVEVKAILQGTADDLGKLGKDAWYGFGRVNAYNAVK